ncbi:LacI family DNA-binding transcriptional regulator [Limosilactobacillus sp.]
MTSIYDIARAVGCFSSTFLKYITKHGCVSEALGKRIASAMTKLDYH